MDQMIGAGLNQKPDDETHGAELHGVVYTQPWAVDLILDLAGYVSSTNLADAVAVEPAAGNGNFLAAMVSRLIDSCRRQNRPIADCSASLLGYEIDPGTAELARQKVVAVLLDNAVAPKQAMGLAQAWIRVGDFLLDPPACSSADFVTGNPPYIRLEHLKSEVAFEYQLRYPTMVGRTNIYIAFFEAALRTLTPGGACAFICADRWMLNQQGAGLRQLITSDYAVETVVEMHRADAFESQVSAYPAATVIRRVRQGPAVTATVNGTVNPIDVSNVVRAIEDVRAGDVPLPCNSGLRASRNDYWFQGAEPWTRTSPEGLSLLRRLEDQFQPLESTATGTRIRSGLATGADDIFISTNAELVESCRLLPLALTRDTASGTFSWSGHYLVNPWNELGLVDLLDYPQLHAYLERHENRLRDRYVAKNDPEKWYRTIDRVDHRLVHEAKLFIPDIKDWFNPVLDTGGTYPHHNLYFLQSDCWDLEVLGGLLLSSVAQFFIESYGTRIRGGYLRFQAQYLRRIRVPRPSDMTISQAGLLVEAFRFRDRDLATCIALDLYRIDQLPSVG